MHCILCSKFKPAVVCWVPLNGIHCILKKALSTSSALSWSQTSLYKLKPNFYLKSFKEPSLRFAQSLAICSNCILFSEWNDFGVKWLEWNDFGVHSNNAIFCFCALGSVPGTNLQIPANVTSEIGLLLTQYWARYFLWATRVPRWWILGGNSFRISQIFLTFLWWIRL